MAEHVGLASKFPAVEVLRLLERHGLPGLAQSRLTGRKRSGSSGIWKEPLST
jgi:hypothetical protein